MKVLKWFRRKLEPEVCVYDGREFRQRHHDYESAEAVWNDYARMMRATDLPDATYEKLFNGDQKAIAEEKAAWRRSGELVLMQDRFSMIEGLIGRPLSTKYWRDGDMERLLGGDK